MEPHRLGALLPGSLPLRLTARQLTPDWCFGRTDLLPPLPLACLITHTHFSPAPSRPLELSADATVHA